MIDVYLSTIGEQAAVLARKHGLGIEIAEFSYAVNMDTDFPYWEDVTRANLSGIERRIFHAPYSELCPSAADPLVLEVTRHRLEQAFKLARSFEINRMVVHSGFIPYIYFKDWFVGNSAHFWHEFLSDKPSDFTLLLENVMEDHPGMLRDIVEETGDPRLQLCLDIGHAGGVFSDVPVIEWIEVFAPYLGHVHVHNNYNERDNHNPPGEGLINMKEAVDVIIDRQPRATFTAETEDTMTAVSWFQEQGYIV